MVKAGAKYRKLLGLGTAIVPLATIGLIGAADAKITRIEIAKTTQAFEGAMFGAVGAYEQLDGTAYGEIDPRDPLNALADHWTRARRIRPRRACRDGQRHRAARLRGREP
jgi:hypothetical protein